MRIDLGRFTVRLAENETDVAAAQRLRYRVFVEEMNATVSPENHAARREADDFDQYFDHLILIDNEAKPDDPLDYVAGVYRLLRGEVARQGCGFYGETEYDLSKVKNYPREVVELGRSCIDAEYRGGSAMHLLWTGLGKYLAEYKIEIMFGVASFHGADPGPLALPLSYLYHNHLAPEDLRVRTLDEYYVDMNIVPADQIKRAEAMKQIPTLIKAYIRLGGFVGDGAYVDRDFNTVDVCLLMDTARMVDRYRDYYQRESRGAQRILG